jgi:hypothetical protein
MIALANAAQLDSPSATFFAYDPSGVSTVSGAANSFPFLYQGLEHEVTDPGQLYFEPSGNVYDPQIQRELSQVGPQGITAPFDGGAGSGGFGNFGSHRGSPGGPSGLSTAFNDLEPVAIAAGSVYLTASPFNWLPFGFGGETATKIPIPLLGNLLSLFNFGGGSSDSEKPYQDDHGRNQNWGIVGVADGLTPTQKSAKCRCPTAPVLPRSTVDDNIRATQAHGSGWYGRAWWITKVAPPYGDWAYNYDYPGAYRKWDSAGNFNFGATGRACGYQDSDLVPAAAELQILNGTYGNGRNSKALEIRQGERYYDCGCYKH